MKQTKQLMGMPISIEIVDAGVGAAIFKEVFDYFRYVDKTYSTYKPNSQISRINNGLPKSQWSQEMQQVLKLCEQTKQETNGYFDIKQNGRLDPSGLVKGWAIKNAAGLVTKAGFKNFYIDVAGDIQVSGQNASHKPWQIGIRNPFNRHEIIKTVGVSSQGVATSGTAIRGQHIYNPLHPGTEINDVASLTVIGPDIFEADRFATAAFAMGKDGIRFIERLPGFEAYLVSANKRATFTTGFERYVTQAS